MYTIGSTNKLCLILALLYVSAYDKIQEDL